MPQERVWRFGPETRKIFQKLYCILLCINQSSDLYLAEDCLTTAHVRNIKWDLTESDDFFKCMAEEDFLALQPGRPSAPIVPYEAVEPPVNAPPQNIFDREWCASSIAMWFEELQTRKVAVDGHGYIWPKSGSFWVPREKERYDEELYSGSRIEPNVPWEVWCAFMNVSDKTYPHQVYYGWHADDAIDGVILRSELKILLTVILERVQEAEYCLHIAPVLMLSIHSNKARIMIAYFNRATETFDVKCSPYTQFDGYGEAGSVQHKGASTDSSTRPPDFAQKTNLFFRWLNPGCQGDTLINDPDLGPEMVMRKRKGIKKLVKKKRPIEQPMAASSTSTASSESAE